MSLGLGLGLASSVAPNPILSLSSLQEYMNAGASVKTYSSGVKISSMTSRYGAGFEVLSAGREPDFDTSYFNGIGGITGSDGSRDLLSVTKYTSQTNLFYLVTVEFDASIASNQFVCCLGRATFGESRAGLLVTAGGNLQYARNEADGFDTIASSVGSNRYLVMLDFTSTSNLDIYVNAHSSPTVTIDPSDNYYDVNPAATHFWIGGRSSTDGLQSGAIGDVAYALASPTAAQREKIYNYFNAKYGL